MQAVTLGLNHQLAQYNGIDPPAPPPASLGTSGGMEQAQLQQLVQLLGAKMLPKQTAVVECPKSMVGRVIGKGGETIKALQQYTGAMIQIDQSTDPTRVTIAGSPQSLQLAVSMVNDIVRGTFKGFAMLRQIAIGTQGSMAQFGQPQPVYVQGYGFVPPSQVYNPEDTLSASLMRTSPSGVMTPPLPGMRPPAAPGGGLPSDALAALLAQTGGAPQAASGMQQFAPPPPQQPGGGNDALIAQLLSQLAGQGGPQMPAPQMQQPGPGVQLPQAPQAPQLPSGTDLSGLDPATLQALLAQASMLGGAPQGGVGDAGVGLQGMSSSPQGLPPSAALMMAAQAGAAGTSTPGSLQGVPAGSPPVGSPYAASQGMLSAMLAAGGRPQSMSSRPISSAGSVGSPPGPGMTPPPVPVSSAPPQPASTLTGLLQGTNAAASFLGTSPSSASSPVSGSGRTSPLKPTSLTPASNPATSLKSTTSGESSPLGRFGAIGSAMAGTGLGPAAEDALATKMGGLSTNETGPVPSQLPPGWSKVADAQGLVYYVNQLTGESTLTPPAPRSTGANGMQNTAK